MSGTSADGVDAVLASFNGSVTRPQWRILASCSRPYPPELKERLVAVGQGQCLTAASLLDLAERVTEAQGASARACDPRGEANLIGCHGQTIWHQPPEQTRRGASWQLLQGPLLAELLGRPVVFDFRAADLAQGGHGAPLVPSTDAALLGRIDGWRALLNLGGIANITLLPPAHGPERHSPVLGWDCGPANSLLDLAIRQFSKGKLSFDANGDWARQGQINEDLVHQWLREPYFQLVPPKSTGRELFGATDLQQRLAAIQSNQLGAEGDVKPADVLATLCGFTAALVARDLDKGTRPLELLVSGGGARNSFLMEQLRLRCRGLWVRPLVECGIDDHQREALAFALLAWWHRLGHPGSLPSVTGGRRPAIQGVCAMP